ncbi:MAG: hypothetical protein ACC650_03110 [Gammaproteobacteria bacterium]
MCFSEHIRIETIPRCGFLVIVALLLTACSRQAPQTLITIADARENPAQLIDTGEPGDSVGDMLVFDQPLLDKDKNTIGNNSGSCVRTWVGVSFQCQWTLTMDDGSIQVGGREYDKGSSILSITGGTGKYSGITGEMISTNNNDGTFTQLLRFILNPP